MAKRPAEEPVPFFSQDEIVSNVSQNLECTETIALAEAIPTHFPWKVYKLRDQVTPDWWTLPALCEKHDQEEEKAICRDYMFQCKYRWVRPPQAIVPIPSDSFFVVSATGRLISLHPDGRTPTWLDEIPQNIQRKITAIAVGLHHVLALFDDYTVQAWGDKRNNLCDVPEHIQGNTVAVAASQLISLALLFDKTLSVWGVPRRCNVPDEIQGHVISISASLSHWAAITDSGTLWVLNVWNDAITPLMNIPPEVQGHVVAVSVARDIVLALLENKTVQAWGDNKIGDRGPGKRFTAPPDIQGRVTTVAAGAFRCMALLEDKTVAVWGWQENHVIPGVVQGHVSAIGLSFRNNMVILDDGSIHSWGEDGHIVTHPNVA